MFTLASTCIRMCVYKYVGYRQEAACSGLFHNSVSDIVPQLVKKFSVLKQDTAHKSRALDFILSQTDPFHTITPHYIQPYIALQPSHLLLIYQRLFFPLRFCRQNLYLFLIYLISDACSICPVLYLLKAIIVDEQYSCVIFSIFSSAIHTILSTNMMLLYRIMWIGFTSRNRQQFH